jgi:hypothetical protein
VTRLKLAPVLFLLLAAVLAPALAQTEVTGVIEGTVLGSEGKPVADAVVMSARADGSYPKSTVTDDQGRFRIPFLPPGTYNVTVQAEGFVNQPVAGVAVSATRVARIRVQLAQNPQLQEEVTVSAARPTIDMVTTDRGSSVGTRQIELLPMPRQANALLDLVPGVSQNSAWGAASGQANNYQLDGVGVNGTGFGGDFLLPNPDWIAEFQVKGLGAGAEYGNFEGGLVNIVTKSGSNTFAGAVKFYYEDSSWNASNGNAYEAGSEPDKRWEVNASVSGPIVKDKLYYFVSLQQAQLDTRVVDLDSSTPDDLEYLSTLDERTQQKGLAKFTWQATAKDTFNFYYGIDNVYGDNRGLDSFTQPEATTEQESPASFWNANWQRIFNASNFLTASFTGYTGRDDRLPYNGDIPAIELLGGNADLYQNAIYTRKRKPSTNGLSVDWDSYWDTGSVRHHLKVGGAYEEGKWKEWRERNGNLTWRPDASADEIDPKDPSTWGFISSDWGGQIDLEAETMNAALYVQDYITINPRLTVTAGLRWGSWAGDLVPGFDSGPRFEAVSDNAFDPRLGIIFDVLGDDRLALSTSWGIYHQNLFALMFDRVEGGNVFKNIEYWDWDADFDPDPKEAYTIAERDQYFVFYDEDPLGEEVGPVEGYEQPYVEQWVASVEYQATPEWKLSANYIWREYKELTALVDRNLDSNYTFYPNVTATEFGDDKDRTFKLPGIWVSNDDILYDYYEYGDVAPGFTPEEIEALNYDQDLVLTSTNEAQRKFQQVQLIAEKGGGTWGLRGSIVWTDLKGNWDSVSGYSDTEGGEGAGGFVRPNEQINWDGRLPLQPEWELKVDWFGDIYWGFRGGAFLRWFTGNYFTRNFEIRRRGYAYETAGGESLPNSLLFSVDRQVLFMDPRGSDEYDSVFRLDLRLERPIRLGKDLELLLQLDCFNVTNSDAVVAQKTSVNFQDSTDPTTLYGAPRLRQAPRAFQLMAGLAW